MLGLDSEFVFALPLLSLCVQLIKSPLRPLMSDETSPAAGCRAVLKAWILQKVGGGAYGY